MQATFLPELLVIIIAAFLGGFAARTFKLPPVLGYVISGIIFGTVGKNFLHSYSQLVELSHIGISLLLFTMGFEISLDTFKKLNKKIFIIGILQVSLTMIVLLPVFLLLGLPIPTAIFFSYICSFSSTVVVVKLLEERGQISNFPGTHVFVYLLLQDLFVVPVIFLLPLLFSKSGISSGDFTHFLIVGMQTLVMFLLLFLISKFFLSKILSVVFRYPNHELNILATIFVAAISIGLFQSMGVPQSLAAFLAGVLISEQGKNLRPLSEIRPIRDILVVIFFVTTGMLLQLPYVLSHIVVIVLMTIAVLTIKYVISFFLLLSGNYFPSAAAFIASYLTNIGEFAIIVAEIALFSHFISEGDYNILLSIFVFSVLLVPIWVYFSKVFQDKFLYHPALSILFSNHPHRFKKIESRILSDHIIICGHGRVGNEVRSILDLAEISYIVIDFDKKVVNDLISLGKDVIYGDPTDEEILKVAHIRNAKLLVIALPDAHSQKKIIRIAKQLNKNIHIICRTREEHDKLDLLNLGVSEIVVPEIEAGLKIGHEAISVFGISHEKSMQYLKHIRKQHLL